MTKSSQMDQELIKSLAQMLNDSDLAEIEIEKDDFRVRITRSWPIENQAAPQYSVAPAQIAAAPVAAAAAVPANVVDTAVAAKPSDDIASNPGTLTSPMVGTTYLSPEPDASPFVTEGSKVSEGQTVLIIEAMKTMNQIPAHRSGTIVKILVDDSQPVEYGEPLVLIE
ncbi:MAG: acetyl-CoA carboxylase biotin carboxyl carrier protein [Devosiaceae bacterium]|nr:acetyl-CoA carboxylase biotin carboxyl carrier protein [Devosiaceae bacterium]